MGGYDLVDEAIIDAPPETVWTALLAELHGAGRFWIPHNTFRTGDLPADHVGAEVQVTVHVRGVDQPGPKLRAVARTRRVEPARLLEGEYVSGHFRGTISFVLTPVDGDRTRLAVHFRARPAGVAVVLAKLNDMGAEHSAATREALRNLGRLLGRPREQNATVAERKLAVNGAR